MLVINKLIENEGASELLQNEAKQKLEDKLDGTIPLLQLVWDNLNIRSSHRFERTGDFYSDTNFDWMASLWTKDRVIAAHMEHLSGKPLKNVTELSIDDHVASQTELEYLFMTLVDYFSHSLIERYPNLFKSISKLFKECRPHQFQKEMNAKSEEMIGKIFTKSEAYTEEIGKPSLVDKCLILHLMQFQLSSND